MEKGFERNDWKECSRETETFMNKYIVYILQNPKGDLYIGQTTDIEKRLERHSQGHGARYTADHKNFKLVYSENFPTRQAAMQRETQLKKWSRQKKLALIRGDKDQLRALAKRHT